MGNFTNTYQELRNLTCRPRDNLTFRKELERQCHIHMLILLVAAFTVGCLLMITIRAINKYWCSLRRRVSRPISQRWSNRSGPLRYFYNWGNNTSKNCSNNVLYLSSRKRYRFRTDFCEKSGLKYCKTVKRTRW